MVKIKYNSLLLLAALLTTSCGSFLEEYSQNLQYITKWQDLDELLIGGCYVNSNSTSNYYAHSNPGMFIHLVADEVEENNCAAASRMDFDNHSHTFGHFTWQHRSGMSDTFTDFYPENTEWTAFYKSINVANNIVNSAANLPETTDVERLGKMKVEGEARFVRAYLYFWLTNTYGQPYNPATADAVLGVPLKTSDQVEDIEFQRNTQKECYNLIENDLLEAERLLAAQKQQKKSIYRADSVAVQLLLSRFYLFKQDWAKARLYAQKVIAVHPELQNLNSDKSRVARKENIENIFSMGGDDLTTIMDYAYKSFRVSHDLYNKYTMNDHRRTQYFWTYGPFIGITKYEENPQYSSSPASQEYYYYEYHLKYGKPAVSSMFWLRSSEAYINLAEALAYSGEDTEALKVLNDFRSTRYYPDSQELSAQYSHEELIREIRLERRKEFCCEGQRWFDLRRYRVNTALAEKISIAHSYTFYGDRQTISPLYAKEYVLTEDDPTWTLPIPNEVLQFNTIMTGNNNPVREGTNIEIRQ